MREGELTLPFPGCSTQDSITTCHSGNIVELALVTEVAGELDLSVWAWESWLCHSLVCSVMDKEELLPPYPLQLVANG